VNRVGRMNNNGIALHQTRAYFGDYAIVVGDLYFAQTRFPFLNCECHPIIAASEKSAGRHLENVVTMPDNNTCIYAVTVAQLPTGWRWVQKIHSHFYALLFDAER